MNEIRPGTTPRWSLKRRVVTARAASSRSLMVAGSTRRAAMRAASSRSNRSKWKPCPWAPGTPVDGHTHGGVVPGVGNVARETTQPGTGIGYVPAPDVAVQVAYVGKGKDRPCVLTPRVGAADR